MTTSNGGRPQRREDVYAHLKGLEEKLLDPSVRHAAHKVADLLTEAGFARVQLYGSLTGTPYDQTAQWLVAVATK